ncbi:MULTISPECIES: 5'/3'-nucleotidase SurE [Okeania]|uniref:5'/3'-nucleotidase SurE n=2 Tax=Microcoleaceae TaxID=1892252 RepID=UPI000F536C74|nr:MULTISPECIES: 5'/3'-nucleotidase SurE [Okeania]NES77072.1 5'/3'-nucleotidase SurE [Okeania sp. SIO1H4]NET21386.1 5'/3'-nucleotidase SurE [Okeania sp. SIO1H5]NET77214.1 5'/3'-nucleotidase SurE [Okeania sp. SIO1F9]NET93950.1 5'/3'-nucleotidase SurE [Okeania sp. SIO1H2]RQH20406.1 5'/3'-nucleotidase SurE [Okeania hirsuta]
MADSKAILIGIDGAQLEEYLLLDLQGEAPNINNLDIIESFIGGIVGTASEQATSSGPGWSTILTGVWADKHGIPSNNSQPVNAEIDSIFEYVDNNIPDATIASIVNWSPINTGHFAPEMGFIPGIPGIVDFEQNGLPDDVAAATVADLVLAEAPDFTFVQLDEVDGVGHSFGFSDEYNDSLITADDQVGMILDANVAVDTNFVIEFNEDVQVGAGEIAIAADDTIVETIDVTSSQVIVEGDTVTINPNNNLTANTDYFVQVDEGAFRDTANTITLFTEDFEGLTLEPFVSPTEGGGDGTDFTTTPPEGWTQDNSTTPTGGPIEFFGWTFLDKNSWAASAGGQRRNEFTKGVGTVMVADPDEYDDADVDINPDLYNAFIQTPAIDLTEIEANTAFLTFDSSWRPEDNQKANLTVSFDGGEPIELLRWTSDPNDPNFKPDESTNETLSIPLNNPEDASSAVLNFGVFEAGNDWWWAVDNILVQGSGETVSGNPFAGITDDTTWNFQTTNDLEPGEESLEILLVNDDGFEADGINVMFEALTEAGYNVTLVAPKEQQSGRGTLINVDQIFQPTEVVNFEENKWFVDGSPVVTTWAALDFILDGNEPDLVISGINEGANIGSNIVISSGTVSAASTAIQRGIPAIAVSAGTGSDEEKLAEAYDIGADFVVEMIQQLEENDTEQLLPDGVGLNVNIPTEFAEGVEEIQGVKFTALDEVSTLDLRFGELPETFGEGVGVLIDFNSPISPDEVTNINSEGEQFLAGAITVTPIDGDWSGSEEIRDSLSQRIEAAPENVTAEPLDILITNDDGFEAEGIKVLYETLTVAGHNVTLVAPKEQQSGKGTVLDVDAIFQPTEVVNFEENQWFVDGAPRTTTWAALDFVLDDKPDLVISGINEGENIGPGGAVSSGTVSAAVTALLRDVPAIAISAGIDFEDETVVDEAYEIGADFVTNLISQLQATQELDETILPEGTGLSINIPVRFPEGIEEIQGVKFTSTSDITPFDIDFGELPSGGAGLGFAPVELPPDADIEPNSEGGEFLSGFITVTPLDGSWNAPEALRDEVQDLISPLLTPTPQPNVLIGSAESDTLTGLLGDDEIIGNAGDDVLRGEGGRSSGGQAGGDDTISGGVGNDRIGGKGGNDELYGDEGDDLIWGDDGDDLIRGGLGDDVITGDNFSGGQGSDTFILAVGEGTDTIVDFEVGTDFIGLAEGLTFADLSFTGNSIISGEETLAILNGINTTALTESDFTSV